MAWKSHKGAGEVAQQLRTLTAARQWWRMPLIPAFGKQRQADFWVRGQLGLQSEFQDSQGYTEKPCLKKKQKTKQQQKKTMNVWSLFFALQHISGVLLRNRKLTQMALCRWKNALRIITVYTLETPIPNMLLNILHMGQFLTHMLVYIHCKIWWVSWFFQLIYNTNWWSSLY